MDKETRLAKARFAAELKLKKEMHKGDPGYTPVKGKDYFTPREIEEMRQTILAMIRVPKDGKDAVVDYEKILRYTYAKVAEHVAKIPVQKGDKGDNGEPGKDAVVDMEKLVQRVITALPKQKDKKLVIDREQILKLIDERVSKIPASQSVRIGGSVASIRALTDVNISNLTQDEKGNYILGGSSTSLSAGTNVTITGTGTVADPYVISTTGAASGDMTKIVYDTNDDGVVDQADAITSQGALATLNTVGTAQIDNDAVTFDKIQNVNTNKLIGRDTAGTGSVEEIAVGTGLEFSGASAIQVTNYNNLLASGDNVSSLTNDAGYLTSYTETDPVVGAVNGLVKANGAGAISAAVADTDYLTPGTAASTYQPLDADLTAIAAANNSAVLAATTASFTTADETKLDGIEAGADVTDTANVTAAGALMDSEVDADIKTLALPANTTISTFGASLVDDTTAAAARTTLGAYGSGDDPTFGLITYDAARGKVTAGGSLGATETINFNSETNYTGTLDSNITFTFANATSGDDVTLYLSYDGTAQRTITWPTVTWLDNATGAAPATPSASGNVLVVTIRYVGTTYYASATGNYAVYA